MNIEFKNQTIIQYNLNYTDRRVVREGNFLGENSCYNKIFFFFHNYMFLYHAINPNLKFLSSFFDNWSVEDWAIFLICQIFKTGNKNCHVI